MRTRQQPAATTCELVQAAEAVADAYRRADSEALVRAAGRLADELAWPRERWTVRNDEGKGRWGEGANAQAEVQSCR